MKAMYIQKKDSVIHSNHIGASSIADCSGQFEGLQRNANLVNAAAQRVSFNSAEKEITSSVMPTVQCARGGGGMKKGPKKGGGGKKDGAKTSPWRKVTLNGVECYEAEMATESTITTGADTEVEDFLKNNQSRIVDKRYSSSTIFGDGVFRLDNQTFGPLKGIPEGFDGNDYYNYQVQSGKKSYSCVLAKGDADYTTFVAANKYSAQTGMKVFIP